MSQLPSFFAQIGALKLKSFYYVRATCASPAIDSIKAEQTKELKEDIHSTLDCSHNQPPLNCRKV